MLMFFSCRSRRTKNWTWIFRCIDSQRGAALGRQKKFYAKLHKILCWWYWSWRVTADSSKIEGIKVNRLLNSPKFGDDPIGQVFAYVIASSNGFERVAVFPCSRSGWCEKRSSMIGECAFFGYFFKLLPLTVRIPLFKWVWHKHRKVNSSLDKLRV